MEQKTCETAVATWLNVAWAHPNGDESLGVPLSGAALAFITANITANRVLQRIAPSPRHSGCRDLRETHPAKICNLQSEIGNDFSASAGIRTPNQQIMRRAGHF